MIAAKHVRSAMRELRPDLRAAGVDHRYERGTKHLRVRLSKGKAEEIVGTSYGTKDCERKAKLFVASARRAIRRLAGERV